MRNKTKKIRNSKKNQQILLSNIFNNLRLSKTNRRYISVACAIILSRAFEETTQDEQTGNNVLHYAALTGKRAFNAVQATLREKWQNFYGTSKKPKTLSTGKAAELCGVSRSTVTRWFDRGELPGHIAGRRDRKILVSDLATFMKERDISTDSLSFNGEAPPSKQYQQMEKGVFEKTNNDGKKPEDLCTWNIN